MSVWRRTQRKEQQEAAWQVKHGATLVGTLFLLEVDQPWFRCRFEPSGEWDSVSPLFEAQEEARAMNFPEDMVWSIAAVRDLNLELHPVDGGENIRPVMICIGMEQSSFRY
ncbi:hypothetical protein BLA24_30990 [Streptomyces cinnamoneus]|uniref:Uncharacterized protein n=2 Tax=Streptomyces cinnamoneus TaxID=53446 RepID=A0A2G1X9M7_STRCJ|nr:hypothetical protein [Streptomyces cinnamoneus]PHQ47928.1 hypothetical protein BLA24_30990 [Streptomyces cinnamoneus]PPT15553.1 hypothetical protein CYQ11_24090 [Streptomyces cinnamoneus]